MTQTTTPNLAHLRQLHAEATPGPWTRLGSRGRPDYVQIGPDTWHCGRELNDTDQAVRDARLIVEAHEALPALLDELEELRGAR